MRATRGKRNPEEGSGEGRFISLIILDESGGPDE
jgi:hypothetical protein